MGEPNRTIRMHLKWGRCQNQVSSRIFIVFCSVGLFADLLAMLLRPTKGCKGWCTVLGTPKPTATPTPRPPKGLQRALTVHVDIQRRTSSHSQLPSPFHLAVSLLGTPTPIWTRWVVLWVQRSSTMGVRALRRPYTYPCRAPSSHTDLCCIPRSHHPWGSTKPCVHHTNASLWRGLDFPIGKKNTEVPCFATCGKNCEPRGQIVPN